jgi:hypothetical protein
MIIVSFLTLLLLSRKWKNVTQSLVINSIFIILVQVILDLVVLIGVLRMPLDTWLITILPVYIIVIPLSSWTIRSFNAKN